MGYSTMLYAVDIGALKSAVGSKDEDLVERVRETARQREGREQPVDPTKGPRVRVAWDSQLFLYGKPVTPDELKEALLSPEWKGTNLYWFQESKSPTGKPKEGAFKELGSFMRFVMTLVPFFEERGLIFKKHIVAIHGCSDEEEFLGLSDPDDEITPDQALEEVVAGKFTRKDCAHQYGYALEQLCLTLGTFLDAVGTDQLRSLGLKTPLSRTRSPVKLPKINDFPYISYLDADEVRAEVERLRALDLSCPRDAEVEAERKAFLNHLETAVHLERGIVGFYY